jgi:hypothetical protein
VQTFYFWCRFLIIESKQQLELGYLEWKLPSYSNNPLHVFLSVFLWLVNLYLSSNRAFYVSATRESLQLMCWSWVKISLNMKIISAEALRLKCQHRSCINKAKYNLNLCFTSYYIIMAHETFVQIMIWIPYLGYYRQCYSLIRLLTTFVVGE